MLTKLSSAGFVCVQWKRPDILSPLLAPRSLVVRDNFKELLELRKIWLILAIQQGKGETGLFFSLLCNLVNRKLAISFSLHSLSFEVEYSLQATRQRFIYVPYIYIFPFQYFAIPPFTFSLAWFTICFNFDIHCQLSCLGKWRLRAGLVQYQFGFLQLDVKIVKSHCVIVVVCFESNNYD